MVFMILSPFTENWLCLPYALIVAHFFRFVIKLVVENTNFFLEANSWTPALRKNLRFVGMNSGRQADFLNF